LKLYVLITPLVHCYFDLATAGEMLFLVSSV